MNTLYLLLAVFLWLTIIAGVVRLWRSPSAAERRQACRLLGASGVAIVFLLAQAFPTSVLRDVVVLFSLLTVVTVVAFALLTWPDPVRSGRLDSEQALIESREADRLA